MGAAMVHADAVRLNKIQATEEEHRSEYSQYLTPPETAALAVKLFSDYEAPMCLDLGAGTGILSVALYERYGAGTRIDAIEIDDGMRAICDAELTSIGIEHTVLGDDALTTNNLGYYDRVILNPPYKKMAADDFRQAYLPERSPNLYSAFLMIAISHLKPGGECVAIIPRSWMNGQYFQPFRKWMFDNSSLDAVHVYGSRTEIFSDTNVLQETMLVKISKTSQKQFVYVSESHEKGLAPVISKYRFDDLVDFSDLVVRIKPSLAFSEMTSLREAGFCASTGKVVDFRSRSLLRETRTQGSYRLVYSFNFPNGVFKHPIEQRKMQWFEPDDEKSEKQLLGPGCTVVVKRFSSKEEKRRVVPNFFKMDERTALENHVNYIHQGTPRKTVLLDEIAAKGLSVWLGTTFIDSWFRDVSGSTQVNASDLNKMPVPEVNQIYELGKFWHEEMSTDEIDEVCKEVLFK